VRETHPKLLSSPRLHQRQKLSQLRVLRLRRNSARPGLRGRSRLLLGLARGGRRPGRGRRSRGCCRVPRAAGRVLAPRPRRVSRAANGLRQLRTGASEAAPAAVTASWTVPRTSTSSREVPMNVRPKNSTARCACSAVLKPTKAIWRERPSLRSCQSLVALGCSAGARLVRRILASVTSPRAEKCSRRRTTSACAGRFFTQMREELAATPSADAMVANG